MMHEHQLIAVSFWTSILGGMLFTLFFIPWLKKQRRRWEQYRQEAAAAEIRAARLRYEQDMEAQGVHLSPDNPFRLNRW